MNIVVCVKQVPDNAQVKMDAAGALKLDGVERILNPFDEYAVEEGLRLKEKLGGKVILLSMGLETAVSALREAISLGADEAVLCCDPAFDQSDTNATAKILAKALAKIKEKDGSTDIVLLGRQTMDGDTAQVGPQLAVHAGLPGVMYVKKFEEVTAQEAKVHRMTEEGYDVVRTPLPAVFGTVKEINVPRLPSLKGKLRAKDAPITKWTMQDLGLASGDVGAAGSGVVVKQIVSPSKRPEGKVLNGEAPAMVEGLITELQARQLI